MTSPTPDIADLDFQPSCSNCGKPATQVVCTSCCNQIRLWCDTCQQRHYAANHDKPVVCADCGKRGRYLDLIRWWSL